MKIFFDARYIRIDFHDGISRFSTELGKALAKLTDVTFLIWRPEQIKFLPKDATYITINSPTSIKELYTAKTLNKYKPDVIFSPMQIMGSRGRKFKLILTFHDTIHYRHRTPPRTINQAIRIGWYLFYLAKFPQQFLLNGADIIATVSNTMEKEIIAGHFTKRPIIVTHNAPQQLLKIVKKVNQTKPPHNIVYMGTFMPYKNVETIIKGMEWLPGRTLHLLSMIKSDRKKQLEAIIPMGTQVVFHNGVSDEEYAKILADNAVLVTASLDEGYGIPVAEAQAMGVPTVVSDLPIFHEVGGSGALYFNPKDPRAFAEQVQKLDNDTLRHKLITASLKHAATFSWERSAKTLLAAIKSLV